MKCHLLKLSVQARKLGLPQPDGLNQFDDLAYDR